MFRKLDATKESINCWLNAGLTNKFGIPALATKAISLLSPLIGGIGAVFYMVFIYLFKQANKQLCSSISNLKPINFDKYITDSYTQRVEESTPISVFTNVPVEEKMFRYESKSQIKIVIMDLFFCALFSAGSKIAKQSSIKLKNVEQKIIEKQENGNNSSTEKLRIGFLSLFPIRINQINKLNKTEPAFSEMLKAR